MLYGIRFLGIGQNDRSSSGTEGGSSQSTGKAVSCRCWLISKGSRTGKRAILFNCLYKYQIKGTGIGLPTSLLARMDTTTLKLRRQNRTKGISRALFRFQFKVAINQLFQMQDQNIQGYSN